MLAGLGWLEVHREDRVPEIVRVELLEWWEYWYWSRDSTD